MVVVLGFHGSVALAMTVSGSLVQVNGRQRSFQAAMKCSIAAMRSATVGNLLRRRAWRVMIEKNASSRFSHGPEVGVKCGEPAGDARARRAPPGACGWPGCRPRRAAGGGDRRRPASGRLRTPGGDAAG